MEEEKEKSKAKAVLFSAGRITRKYARAGLILAAILAPIGVLANYYGEWIFQVRTNYGVVITRWDGKREAITEPGWYKRIPVFSEHEAKYPMANQVVFLHGKTQPHQVVTKGGKVAIATASTFYSITDLHQYAIENVRERIDVKDDVKPEFGQEGEGITFAVTPKEMIQRTLDSVIGGIIQKTEQDKLIHERTEVEKEIYQALEDSDLSDNYGIEINAFRLPETNYVPKVVEANAHRQALVATAEGKFQAAKREKQAIETLASAEAETYNLLEEALNPKTPAEREHVRELFRSIVKYRTIKDRTGDTAWIVPDTNSPAPMFYPGRAR